MNSYIDRAKKKCLPHILLFHKLDDDFYIPLILQL